MELHPAGADRRARWLGLARLVWLAFAAFILFVDVAQLVRVYPFAGRVCAGPDCPIATLTPQEIAMLVGSGITPRAFGSIKVLSDAVQALIWIAVAFFLFWRRPGDWEPLVASFALLIFGSAVLSPLFTEQVLPRSAGFLPSPLLLWLKNLVRVVGEACFALILVFPDGRFIPRWTRWAFLAWLLIWLPAIFLPGYDPFLTMLAWPWVVIPVAIVIGAQLYRYHRAAGTVQRQQTKWILFSLGITTGFFAIGQSLASLYPAVFQTTAANLILEILLPFIGSLIPISFGLSMLRYRLWEIDVIIRRTLIYGLLTAVLAVGYFSSVVVIRQVLLGSSSPFAVVISTLAMAALFSPLRRRLQDLIDRRFYRRRYDAERTLERFSGVLRSEVNLDQLNRQLAEAVEETIQPEHVTVWLARYTRR
jgi:hypothetical protein